MADSNHKPLIHQRRTSGLINEPKLDWEDVNFIRLNFVEYDRQWGCKAMAARFDVSVQAISKVVNGDTWKPREGMNDALPPMTRKRILRIAIEFVQKMEAHGAKLRALADA